MSNTSYDNNTNTTPLYSDELNNDDNIQHGIDDSPTGDAQKGATLGGIGGVVTGAVAGSAAGPLGAVAGAIIGGIAGAVASGAAVGAIDRIDNDNNISGVGSGITTNANEADTIVYDDQTGATGYNWSNPGVNTPGNGIPGVQTGGHDIDGTPDTRGIGEKIADSVTGDDIDDKTGMPVLHDTLHSDANAVRNDVRSDWNAARNTVDNTAYDMRSAANSGIGTGISRETELGETMPSLKTGGVANDGTPIPVASGEKVVDAVTGDDVDDKTGKVVDHP